MEILEMTTAAENRESLNELIDEYKTLKDDYTLQGARKQMLDIMLAGTFTAQPIDKICSTQRLDAFFSMTKQLSDNYALLNADDEIIEHNQDSDFDEHVQLELNRGQELLQKILDEQDIVKSSITTTQKQMVEINNDTVISSKENTAPTNARNPVESKIDNLKLRGLEKTLKTTSDVSVGLRTLTGVKSIEVTNTEEKGGVQLLITIQDCSFALSLDADKRICDIKTISGKLSLDLVKLVQDSRVLPCPQDLRYAVFALGASQNAAESVRNHLPELRKSCIVRILGPLQFELGMPNSITAVIAVHDCYPEVPAGVHILSLLGVDESPKEIELLQKIKASTNACSFRTIPAMFSFLMGPNQLGSY